MAQFPDGQLYIDGTLRPAQGGRLYPDIGPWTGEIVAHAADASERDMEEAIAAARRAFDESDWSRDLPMRREAVRRFTDRIVASRERLAQLAIHEVGATTGGVFTAHVDNGLESFDMLFDLFDRIEWTRDLGDRSVWGSVSNGTVVKEAAGVVGAIVPWNVPVYITIGKVIPALLAGCTVILKPAPDTPLIGAIFGEIAAEAGLPPGVFNVVTGQDPAFLGEMLVRDRRVDLISFTGSTGVGRRIMEAGSATLKRLFLELGGKSAAIVLDDTEDFDGVIAGSIVSYHAGQGCAAITRLLVPRSRYAEAVGILENAYRAYAGQWGDAQDPAHMMGPVISVRQRDRILGYIESGLAEGARLIAGGSAATGKGGGFFIEPTCFVDVTPAMRIAREEIFGPVLVVIPFEDEEEAIRIANDTDFGLSGAVYAGDPDHALEVALRLRTGSVGINGGMPIAADLPFGGYKQSGIGREWGADGFEEYLEQKVVAVRRP